MTMRHPSTHHPHPIATCATHYPPKGGYSGGGAATGPISRHLAPPCATLKSLGGALADPAVFAERFGARGFVALVAFVATAETLFNLITR